MYVKTGLVLGGILACASAWADQSAPITMHYHERKPLHYSDGNGNVIGILAAPIERSFAKAGIPFVWRQTPMNRIMATIKANDGPDCIAGVYTSAERESMARLSLPIYRDKGLVMLARADFPAPATVSARELLARPQTRLLLKQGYVYGSYLDPLIAKMAPTQVQRVTDEIDSMIRMLRAGAADIIVTTEEEAETYVNPEVDSVRLLHLSDVTAREYRYIVCSKRVPQETMDKLNAAIATLPVDGSRKP
ncbi:MAG: transporter substrate-binding domain-containing protein [Burkholderiaceae bacterium]|nr:transporter substrate-binding domain-containing protein [Burkholderiaceae bacterium]